MEIAIAIEDSYGSEAMEVSMWVKKIPKGLRCHDHGGDRVIQLGEALLKELFRRCVGDSGELTIESAIEEETSAQHLGDGKDNRSIGDLRQDLLGHSFSPGNGSLFSTRGT